MSETPTPRELQSELEAWRVYLETGSMRVTAERLGVHEITVRKRIAVLRDVYDVRTNAQLADAMARAELAKPA